MLECMRDANEAKGFGLLRNNQSIGIDDYYDVTLSLHVLPLFRPCMP
jgi:hypothetical protein